MLSDSPLRPLFVTAFFFFTDPAPTEIYTLSLHDALPIFRDNQPTQIPIDDPPPLPPLGECEDRKSTRLNSSHVSISYAVFCLKKKRCARIVWQERCAARA